jgi:hypothetical protein
MSFWEEIRSKVREHTTASDISESIYRKLATSGINQMPLIKPSFYLGRLSTETFDFMETVEKFLEAPENDLGTCFRHVIYLRECARALHADINEVDVPLELLIEEMEELSWDEFEEEEEEFEEEGDEPAGVAEEEAEESEEEEEGPLASRDDLTSNKEEMDTALRSKLLNMGISEVVSRKLALRMAEVYLECVQFTRELKRLSETGDEDIETMLSIMVDLQYGLHSRIRYLLFEDISFDDETNLYPGLVSWSAFFLEEVAEKLNEEKS